MEKQKDLATRLISARGEKAAVEVAKACGISNSALSMYETGKRVPRDEIKVKLAKCYNTTVGALFFED